MLIHGKVPSLFGCGIIVPLLKNNNLDNSIASNYRGITLSSHISKLFEMCILDIDSVYFTTSDLQMGFKKKIGCAHALYTVRSVVDYFTSGDSVVNLCALDIIYILFYYILYFIYEINGTANSCLLTLCVSPLVFTEHCCC